MLWIMNGATGDFLASLAGHEDEILCAKFTQSNGGKQIVSSGADCSIRVWSPIKQECLKVIKASKMMQFHDVGINVLELHHSQPLALSGDLNGRVCYSNYNTGEVGGILAEHTDSVESIAICQEMDFAVSVGMDTNIHIYHMKEHKLRQKIDAAQHGGFSKVVFSTIQPNMFYASSTLGFIHIVDVRSGEIMRTYHGH